MIEKENAEKIRRIKSIIDNKPELADVDSFLFGKEEAQSLFRIFYESLKKISDVGLEVQSSKIKVIFNKETFSIIGYAGKTGRKCFLVINTNIHAIVELGDIVDDRVRPGKKRKGSIGGERYEVFITTEDDLLKMLSVIDINYKNMA